MDAQAKLPVRDQRHLLFALLEILPDLPTKTKGEVRIVPVAIKPPTGVGQQRSRPGQLAGQPEDFALMKVAV